MLVQQFSVLHYQTAAFLCIRRQRKSETHFRREHACAFSTRSRLKHTQTDQACVSFHDHLDRAQKARDIKNFAQAPPNRKTHTRGMKQGERQRIWREVIASVWISQFRFNWNSLDRFKQGTSGPLASLSLSSTARPLACAVVYTRRPL